MKIKLILIAASVAMTCLINAAETNKASVPYGLEVALEPYGTMSWTGINGDSEIGAGAAIVFPVGPRGLSLVAFGEGDHEDGRLVERLGAGLRYTAYLGKYVSLDGGIAGAYNLEDPHLFLRLPLGANFTVVRSKNLDVSFRVQYAFDISGNETSGSRNRSSKGCDDKEAKAEKSSNFNDGVATGRLFIGPVATLKF